MSKHVTISPTEAADRLAIRELVEAYARCADRRDAEGHGATAGQVALAWLLQHSPVILPIPGTAQVAHLDENVAAAGLSLTPEEIAELDAAV